MKRATTAVLELLKVLKVIVVVAAATLTAATAIGSPPRPGLDQIAPSFRELGEGWKSNRVVVLVDLLNPDKEICNDGTSWVQAAKNTLGRDGREACLVLRYTYYSSDILVWVTRFETPEHIEAAWVRSEGYQSTSSPAPEIGDEARIYRRGGLHNNFV